MKRSNKFYYNAVSTMFLMGLVCPFVSYAEKMELADDIVKIYSLGQQANSDLLFKKEGNDTIPRKIRITELSLTYKGKQKQKLSIVEKEGDTIYSGNVTNGLTPPELQNYVWLYLSTDKNYEIKHGEKTWNVTFIDTQNKSAADKAKVETPENLVDNGNKESGISWWIYFIIGVLGLACAFLLVPKFRKTVSQNEQKTVSGKKKNRGKKSKKRDLKKSPETGTDNKTESDTVTKGPEVQQDPTVALQSELANLKEKIDSLCPDEFDNNLTSEEKITKAKLYLESSKEVMTDFDRVCHELNIDKNSSIDTILGRIKELKNNSSTASLNELNEAKREICDILITKLDGRNKTLSAMVADARKEKGSNPIDVMQRIIEQLPFKLKEEKPTAERSIKITEEQLKHADNSIVLKSWFLKQCSDAHITNLDKAKTVLDNLNQWSSILSNAQTDAPHKSDEDIVTDVIFEDKLTDDQKKELMRRLVEAINGKITDTSKSVNEKISLTDFVHKVADSLQQPNSQEEAQIRTQQHDLAIINEALKSDITCLSVEAIKESVKKRMVQILRDSLSNISFGTYEEAKTSLATCNNQYKDLAKLIKEYNVDKLSDLPQAIRDKQNRDLISSVTTKVSQLLPNQNIDSTQKLVNALIKGMEDASQTVREAEEKQALVVDDLEERISGRSKEFVASEDNKDILNLMSIYNDLVKSDEAKLKDQVSSKENQISQLNARVQDNEATISSLRKDNQNLMSESDKLLHVIHTGADNILESCKTILNACSDDDEAQCVDIEERLFSDLRNSVDKMKSFKVDSNTTPAETRKRVQSLLVEEISADNSAINTVCRYYAYSRLPFMTDTAREYGITFYRKNMSDLYNSIENLYVQFGINLNVPSLFVMGIEEGDFENVTGKMYGDLDNLCQNSRNHFDNIDSITKPSNVIVDVVNVGYSVDGKVGRITSVLTY